jgi:hypothetical protein
VAQRQAHLLQPGITSQKISHNALRPATKRTCFREHHYKQQQVLQGTKASSNCVQGSK